ncbi:DGQHR domain-containing protein [Brevundimonas sp.]|uniref:DGQHR domain-containing protein n=1 Tax=Brevundimonas sp. TaxID=1871086 RepID=UPI002737B939|nr:DGQHR domain-containing protein [Brevundimonas sp.]MDP3803114.1 DGQHR domain-containing protein [Brevundimonas sp.]
MAELPFDRPVDPNNQSIRLKALRVRQPIGDMYVVSMPHDIVTRVSDFDVRRLIDDEREVETYLGIQRPLNVKRAQEIATYVNFVDATFPSAIILAVSDEYASFDAVTSEVELRNHKVGDDVPSKMMRDLAKVLDGQHRIEGLKGFRGESFDVSVTIFIGADISDQAYIFATVNLEQRKVNRSLAYDLFDLAKSRSPEKTCHNIAVAFDKDTKSPFYHRIKRLGTATDGRDGETITQATFVDGLLQHISRQPKIDRDLLLRKKRLPSPSERDLEETPLRGFFVAEHDLELAQIYDAYFRAVQDRWPVAWASREDGYILNRTNGYRALSRFFRTAFRSFSKGLKPVGYDEFRAVFDGVHLRDEDFTVATFPPGTSGEAELHRRLMASETLRGFQF